MTTIGFTFGLEASFDSYIDYSRFHLLAANNAAFCAVEIEQRKIETELEVHMAHVSSCIMCCVAAIESKINERIFLHKEKIDNLALPKTSKSSRRILNETNILKKLDMLWFVATSHSLPDSPLKEDVVFLYKLRCSLTHYTPEWKSEPRQLIKLQKQIKNKFTINPYYPDKNDLNFPFSVMSASCAKWALQTCQEALDKIHNLNI